MLLGELILASAEVDDQPEREGNIDTVGKEGDFLRHSVLEDFDVVFGQVLNQSAARIAGGEATFTSLTLTRIGSCPKPVATRRQMSEATMRRQVLLVG
jgi:hypothetical protein